MAVRSLEGVLLHCLLNIHCNSRAKLRSWPFNPLDDEISSDHTTYRGVNKQRHLSFHLLSVDPGMYYKRLPQSTLT